MQTQLDAMQSLELDYVKEESNHSFLLFNETLEGGSSHFEYEARDSVLQGEREESRQTDETGDSRLQEYRNSSESQDNMKESGTLSVNMIEESSEEDTRKLQDNPQFKAQNGTNQCSKRTADAFDQIDVEDEFECFKKMIRTIKDQEVKVKSESDNGLANELDPDRMFLLSLWPFLKAIPDRKKLYVRQRIQGVLLDEQEHL
ncbi:uncharacterized protein LOC129953675 [Eupeodes corollae]|uniref:uncharacterized protein LOC129953675 n=1 Tax=Eupeodes corollae TaxID=290404 RepID=UPI00248FFFF3|nr:uncharacterized protein LOC129953675 [Eupeodes corollae]